MWTGKENDFTGSRVLVYVRLGVVDELGSLVSEVGVLWRLMARHLCYAPLRRGKRGDGRKRPSDG
ncbi:MAG: hypothetical protein QXK32_02225 [Candidatus Jordarchaeales archaeon]